MGSAVLQAGCEAAATGHSVATVPLWLNEELCLREMPTGIRGRSNSTIRLSLLASESLLSRTARLLVNVL